MCLCIYFCALGVGGRARIGYENGDSGVFMYDQYVFSYIFIYNSTHTFSTCRLQCKPCLPNFGVVAPPPHPPPPLLTLARAYKTHENTMYHDTNGENNTMIQMVVCVQVGGGVV